MIRSIRLIADDYGLSPGVSDAILDLIGRGRLTGTSCMTGFPEWEQAAERIKPFVGRAAIGLHLTLTDQPALTAPSGLAPQGQLPSLGDLASPLKRRRFGTIDIHTELDAQHRRFVEALGREPDFIDGHQHVHFLPVVRDWLKTRFAGSQRPMLRGAPVLSRGVGVTALKVATIAAMARGFDRSMQAAGFSAMKPLAGIYDWRQPSDFAPAVRRAVEDLPEGGVFMCHPGHVDAILATRDPMQAVRQAEYDFLASNKFGAMLAAAGVTIQGGTR